MLQVNASLVAAFHDPPELPAPEVPHHDGSQYAL